MNFSMLNNSSEIERGKQDLKIPENVTNLKILFRNPYQEKNQDNRLQ